MTKNRFLIPALLFLGVGAVYLSTLAHSPQNRADSSELLTAATVGGYAHPPGYPLYIVFLHIAIKLTPSHNPALIANFVSLILQALTVVFVYLISLHLVSEKQLKLKPPLTYLISLVTALTLAFSTLFWDHATYAEIFPLAGLFVALILWLVVTARADKHWRIFWAIVGLSLAHHQLLALLLPALIIALWPQPLKRWGSAVLTATGAFLASYALLYLFLSPSAPLSWYVGPGLSGVLHLVNRSVYVSQTPVMLEPLMSDQVITHAVPSLVTWLKWESSHFTLVGLILMCVGLLSLKRLKHPYFRFVTFALLFTGPFVAAYVIFPQFASANDLAYYGSTFLALRMLYAFEIIAVLLLPFGLIYLTRRFKLNLSSLVYVALFLPLALFISHFALVSKHSATFDTVFNHQVLAAMPPNAILIADSDLSFGLLESQIVEDNRPDVLILPTALHMRWGYLQSVLPPEIFTIKGYYQLILTLTQWGWSQNRPVFVLDPSDRFITQMDAFHYYLVPHGYALQIAQTPLVPVPPAHNLDPLLTASIHGPNDLWNRAKAAQFSLMHQNLAVGYAKLGLFPEANQELALAKPLLQDTLVSNQHFHAITNQVETLFQSATPSATSPPGP